MRKKKPFEWCFLNTYIYFFGPFCMTRMWHKVNFKSEFSMFEFRSFLLLNKSSYQGKIALSDMLFTNSWRKNCGRYTFPKSTSAMGNANSGLMNTGYLWVGHSPVSLFIRISRGHILLVDPLESRRRVAEERARIPLSSGWVRRRSNSLVLLIPLITQKYKD